MIFTDSSYMKNTLIMRERDAHKGCFGKILVYAGSPGMAGAAILNARAALKSGAGLVQFLLPDFESPLLNIFQISVPEATCKDYSAGMDYSGCDAITAGSGLGTSLRSRRILSEIICSYSGILILDADALNMAAADKDLSSAIRSSPAEIIITPHIGEAKRLLHTNEAISDEQSRIDAALKLSDMYNCIAVLKGAGTLVAAAEKYFSGEMSAQYSPCRIWENTTGNPGMATAGSGDCLAGLIASLAGQGYKSIDAARMGVFVHGKAGDLAAQALGELGMTALDIAGCIPEALRQYYTCK